MGSVTALCEQVGVARSTFYDWMGQESFRTYLTELIDRYADSELASVWKALIRRCVGGDVQAMRLYFDVRGRGRAERPTTVQIIDDIPGGSNHGTTE